MEAGKKVEYRRPIDAKVIDVEEDVFSNPDATIEAALRAIKSLSAAPSESGKKKKKK